MALNLAEILSDEPIDGDGDDTDIGLMDIHIQIAMNGYSVSFSYEDGTEERYVEIDFDEVLKLIRSKH